MAKRGALALRAPFGRTSPVVPLRGAVAPSGVLKRTAQPAGEVAPKRARVAAREGAESPDVQSMSRLEPAARSFPLEVSSSPREDQGISSKRSDKGTWFLSSSLYFALIIFVVFCL